MSKKASSPRRGVLAASAAALGIAVLAGPCIRPAVERPATTAIRPFTVHVPQAELVDLRRRIAATRWPDQETVTDRSQGNQLGKLQELVRYWGTDYDWRKAEAQAQCLAQFMTRSMASTSISSTCVLGTRTPCP